MSEFKDAIEFLGLDPEKIKSIEDLRPQFENDFVRKDRLKDNPDLIAPLIGKRMGSIETSLKRTAKEFGIDFETDEFKGKPIEEQQKVFAQKLSETHLTAVKALEAKVGQTNDSAVKEWQDKYEASKKALSEKESLLTETVGKYQALEQNAANEIKNFKMSSVKDKVWSELKFKTGISDFEKKGFEAHIAENFKFDLVDDKFEIRDKQGNPISNPKVTGSYRAPLDVLTEEAVKANLYELNPHAKNQVKPTETRQTVQQQISNRPINPRLRSQQQ